MKHESGYTLLEVVATLALLALLAVPLGALLTQGFFHYQRAGLRTRDAAAAVALMENLKAQQYTHLEFSLNEEKPPSGEYPYVSGRNNYFESGPDEEAGLFYRLHLLEEAFLLNQEPCSLEILLVEAYDSRGGLILATYVSGWQE